MERCALRGRELIVGVSNAVHSIGVSLLSAWRALSWRQSGEFMLFPLAKELRPLLRAPLLRAELEKWLAG